MCVFPSTQNLLCVNLCLLPPVLSLGTTEKFCSVFIAPSLQILAHVDEVPQLSFLFSRPDSPSQLSQPSFIGEMFQSQHLWPFAGLCNNLISVFCWEAWDNAALQVWPHRHWAEGKDHLSYLAGNAPSAVQDTLSHLCGKGILLVVSVVSLGTLRTFSAELFSWSDLFHILMRGVVLPRAGLCSFPHWTLLNSYWMPSPAC